MKGIGQTIHYLFFRENGSSQIQKPSAKTVERDREIYTFASTVKLDCRILQKL